MHDNFPENRMLPGAVAPTMAIEHGAEQTVSISYLVGVLRRRWKVIFGMTAIGVTIGAVLAARQPPTFEASGLIRLAGERSQITDVVGDEESKPNVGRMED